MATDHAGNLQRTQYDDVPANTDGFVQLVFEEGLRASDIDEKIQSRIPMPGTCHDGFYTKQNQGVICLLFVLEEMYTGGARKLEVIEYIQRRGYLAISPEDVEPYLTQIEPRWNTDIAWRRKDAVEHELLFNGVRDCWEVTRSGRTAIQKIKKLCLAKEFDVRRCYMWSKHLKRALDRSYQPSDQDAKRPERWRREIWDKLTP